MGVKFKDTRNIDWSKHELDLTKRILNQIKLMYDNNYIPSHIEISSDIYKILIHEQAKYNNDFLAGIGKLFGLEIKIIESEKKYLFIPAMEKISK